MGKIDIIALAQKAKPENKASLVVPYLIDKLNKLEVRIR